MEHQNNLPQLEITINPTIVSDAIEKALKEFWDPQSLKNYTSLVKETNKNLIVTEENLKDMETLSKGLGGTRTKVDDMRKNIKKVMEAPIKNFENQVKESLAEIDEVKKPIDDQLAIFEKKRREEVALKVKEWIPSIVQDFGLREECASQIEIDDRWTNRTAKRSDVEASIRDKALTLQELQQAADREERLKIEKRDMAETLCKAQSESMGLITPVTISEIYNLDQIPLSELAVHITQLVSSRKQSEDKAQEKAVEGQAIIPTQESIPPVQEEVARIINPNEDDELHPCVLELLASEKHLKMTKEFFDSHGIIYKFKQ